MHISTATHPINQVELSLCHDNCSNFTTLHANSKLKVSQSTQSSKTKVNNTNRKKRKEIKKQLSPTRGDRSATDLAALCDTFFYSQTHKHTQTMDNNNKSIKAEQSTANCEYSSTQSRVSYGWLYNYMQRRQRKVNKTK